MRFNPTLAIPFDKAHCGTMTPALVLAILSDQVLLAVIAAVVALITAIPTVIIALKSTNKKIEDAKLRVEEKGSETQRQIKEVSLSIDGRLTQLLDEVAKAKHAEGVLAGIAQATEAMSKDKVLDALIAVTPKAKPVELPSVTVQPAPVSEPVKIEVVSMPDQKEP